MIYKEKSPEDYFQSLTFLPQLTFWLYFRLYATIPPQPTHMGDSKMAAPKGNKFWEIRAKHGRDRLLTDPEALRDDCIRYFEWVEENPLEEEKIFSFQGSCNTGTIQKMRAMTVEGLCLHLGIGYSTWREYANRDDCKDIAEVIKWAESVMRQQKFEGAAADLLNPNIIARDLGLREQTAVDHSSADGSMSPKTALDVSKLSASTLEELLSLNVTDTE